MKQTQEIKHFIFSQYFADGLRITFGVLLPSLILAQFGKLEIGITISLGALCVSIVDNPGPARHKRNAMFYCSLILFLIAAITDAINQNPYLLAIEIFAFSFFFSMFTVYGNRISAVGTAALLVMILSMDKIRSTTGTWEHSGSILVGGLWYCLLSMSLMQIRPYRLAQQALAECIREVANYVRLKAAFYDIDSDFDATYQKLIPEQVKVHTQQDTVREILFKSRFMLKESTKAGRLLVLVFVDIVDFFEQTMATLYDYRSMRETFGHTGILKSINRIILLLADELDNLTYRINSNEKPQSVHDLQAELEKLKAEIDSIEASLGIKVLVLKKVLINVRNMANRIQKIYTYFNPKLLANEKIRNEKDLDKFVSHQALDIKLFKENLTFESAIFRHSLRMAIVCLAGFLLAKSLPFLNYSYWILMTILVILKPGFSLTKQRNAERLIGTLVGGIAGALLIIWVTDETSRFILLLVFMIGAYSFQRLNYVVSVLFMTPYVLILFSFLGANNIEIAKERMIDTLIGSAIAFSASYFLFPSWEYNQLRKYMREVLLANYKYLVQVVHALSGREVDITSYKLARKNVYVSSANLGGAFQRMLSEPKSKQRDSRDIHKFVVLNHILSSYTATLISTLQYIEHVQPYPEHIKLIRKSLYALSEVVQQLELPQDDHFKPRELQFPEVSEKPLQTADSDLITEQLQFVMNLSTDILKVSENLRR